MDKKEQVSNLLMQCCMLSHQRGIEECEDVLNQDEADCFTNEILALFPENGGVCECKEPKKWTNDKEIEMCNRCGLPIPEKCGVGNSGNFGPIHEPKPISQRNGEYIHYAIVKGKEIITLYKDGQEVNDIDFWIFDQRNNRKAK